MVKQDIEQNSPDFIKKVKGHQIFSILTLWTIKSWGALTQKNHAITSKPNDKAELKTTLQAIWDDLPQKSIGIAVIVFRK